MPAYRAVIFDFFGTLTRSVTRGPQHADIARDLGCDPDVVRGVLDRTFQSRARGTFGSAEATLRWVSEQAGGRPRTAELLAAVPARVDALKADTRLRARRGERPDGDPAQRPFHGIDQRLYARTAGLPPRACRWRPCSTCSVFSVEVGICKPDPEIYLTACRRLGVEPQECVYVGDGGSRELTGAAAVGMTPVRLDAPDLADHLVFDRGRRLPRPGRAVPDRPADLHQPLPALV